MTWTSQYLNADGSQSGSYGVTYHDGMIPQGIFASGTQVTGIDGKTHDVGGMSYQQAYEMEFLNQCMLHRIIIMPTNGQQV